jgi:flagellar basal body-associated protein FliL
VIRNLILVMIAVVALVGAYMFYTVNNEAETETPMVAQAAAPQALVVSAEAYVVSGQSG